MCNEKHPIIVAIDGYASCGKSTMARSLSRYADYLYVDSGAIYRAITYYCIKNSLFTKDGEIDTRLLGLKLSALNVGFIRLENNTIHTVLNGEDVENVIRLTEVASLVSRVAAIDIVREHVTLICRSLGKHRGIVMDGRDIGTVVFPDAELKIFVTASPTTRARRRFKELKDRGQYPDFHIILANVIERDRIDSTRAIAPLCQAPDALLLDNSNMSHDEQQAWLVAQFDRAVAKNAPCILK